ncbi:hypothetical protein [Lysinibacillus varians]|uniref:Uncharacterized protein n=1 Tax=Lysinibacillus varians TaxID=1145276 RepID=A0ABY2TCY1_9BACI|nr:hypothetical protein [Lysinibacillus varians]AHN24370.1 hypothetical protein T479_16380 [Lysinibacillus varians]TKI66085.1 hypothetical protein FC752_05840 [Lysinibacillus varians]
MTKFIEQRVEVLENEVAELKLIVHELRAKKSIEPSTTNTVEDKPQMAKLVDGQWQPTTYEELAEMMSLTPNQQRAQIIEKAKKFVEENLANGRTSNRTAEKGNSTYRDNYYEVDFFVKEGKVTAVVYWLVSNEKRIAEPSNVGRAKCSPNDVFNEHIGKAIALGRALGLDVSEFEQAVQPDKPVIGMMFVGCEGDVREIATRGHYTESSMKSAIDSKYVVDCPIQIINDTNAIYEVES